MSQKLIPVEGQWYLHLDKGQPFCVLDVDKDGDRIGIQHFDGDIEEFGFAAWFDMDLGIGAEPEDASGPLDDVEAEDARFSDTALTSEDWRTSLEEGQATSETWEDEQHDQP